MYPATISLLLRRWSVCYSTEPFTRGEVVMQENSCIKLSFTFLAGFAQLFMYSLGAWINIMSALKFLAHVSMLIKNPGGKQGVFSHKIRETHKTIQSLFNVDLFLMLEVFVLETNRTNIKLHKVSIF